MPGNNFYSDLTTPFGPYSTSFGSCSTSTTRNTSNTNIHTFSTSNFAMQHTNTTTTIKFSTLSPESWMEFKEKYISLYPTYNTSILKFVSTDIYVILSTHPVFSTYLYDTVKLICLFDDLFGISTIPTVASTNSTAAILSDATTMNVVCNSSCDSENFSIENCENEILSDENSDISYLHNNNDDDTICNDFIINTDTSTTVSSAVPIEIDLHLSVCNYHLCTELSIFTSRTIFCLENDSTDVFMHTCQHVIHSLPRFDAVFHVFIAIIFANAIDHVPPWLLLFSLILFISMLFVPYCVITFAQTNEKVKVWRSSIYSVFPFCFCSDCPTISPLVPLSRLCPDYVLNHFNLTFYF